NRLPCGQKNNNVAARFWGSGGGFMTHFVQSRWLYLFFVVIVGGVAGGWFQAAQQTSTEVPAPTIRVTTHLVLIDAVVTDKQGNPIAGLRPEDFVVEENGKAQKIATFAGPVQTASAPASLPPVSTPIGPSIAQQVGQSQ